MSAIDDRPRIEEGSGNVYADLGFANPEEELLKAKLARPIVLAIEDRGLTQTEAARILGVAQPDVSNLVNGRLAGFSTDRLIRFLTALGIDVEITLTPTDPTRGAARVNVQARYGTRP